jgi:hypothetical protein
MPPVIDTDAGRRRRVGIELEFTDLDIDAISALVADHVGGEVQRSSPYEHRVSGGPHGDWGVELDFSYLKKKGRAPRDPDVPMEALEEVAEQILRFGAEQLVPFEVVSPPIPMDELSEVQSLVERLREAGARGTTEGLMYAFGMQLNPEIPDGTADTLRCYLQAFLCLYDWLKARENVDFTRRLTAFAAPFPRDYVRRVVDPGYAPNRGDLVDDYLERNPTRNRPLDLLPVFLHFEPARVRRAVDDPRVKARPALHYRLPNCEIDRPDWGIDQAWRGWLQVEHLAARPARLRDLCRAYTAFLDRPLTGLLEDWTKQTQAWLIPDGDL